MAERPNGRVSASGGESRGLGCILQGSGTHGGDFGPRTGSSAQPSRWHGRVRLLATQQGRPRGSNGRTRLMRWRGQRSIPQEGMRKRKGNVAAVQAGYNVLRDRLEGGMEVRQGS